ENLVRPSELDILSFELLQASPLVRRETGPLPAVAFRLADPPPQHFNGTADLLCDRSNRSPLRGIFGRVLEDHPHRPLPQLWRVLASSSHGPHPPSEWALRQSRYGSHPQRACVVSGCVGLRGRRLTSPTRTRLETTVRSRPRPSSGDKRPADPSLQTRTAEGEEQRVLEKRRARHDLCVRYDHHDRRFVSRPHPSRTHGGLDAPPFRGVPDCPGAWAHVSLRSEADRVPGKEWSLCGRVASHRPQRHAYGCADPLHRRRTLNGGLRRS